MEGDLQSCLGSKLPFGLKIGQLCLPNIFTDHAGPIHGGGDGLVLAAASFQMIAFTFYRFVMMVTRIWKEEMLKEKICI